MIVRRTGRIEIPAQAGRIAQPVSPDFLPGACCGSERIVVRDPVASVITYSACFFLVPEIGNYPQDFAQQRVEALRVGSHLGFSGFAGPAIARGNIEHLPVRAAWPRRGVENQIAHGMDAGVLAET